MENRKIICLKRTSKKPFPIKGVWTEQNGYKGSPATRATITKIGEEDYEIEVYAAKGSWFECSSSLDKITNLQEAKQWIIEHYGGKWCND